MKTVLAVIVSLSASWMAGAEISLSDAKVRVEGRNMPAIAHTVAEVLSEELAKRETSAGRGNARSTAAPDEADTRSTILLSIERGRNRDLSAEGFRLTVEQAHGPARIRITGADGRGLLYGAGYLLRQMRWTRDGITVPGNIETASAPAYPIRGHQLGYRARANSWDAWTPEQFDQHIRELALFGGNCIENIPFEDSMPSLLMKLPRREMNRVLSEICAKYDQDYWVWTPADFDLLDAEKRAAALETHEELYRDCPRLDAVFFPGGDPGNNHPSEVMPFLADIAKRLHKHHPKAGVWISLQGFNQEKVDYFYTWLEEHKPRWFTGVVSGPSSPPIDETRKRLAPAYRHRHYPDITHVVRAQYPMNWLDQAFALTLGREPVNPTPLFQALLHNSFAPHTDGFLTYSDGVHDDVNKAVWSQMGWDPQTPVREVLLDYCRFFFGAEVAEDAADGILALEKHFEGPLATNGGVSATLDLWNRLTAEHPHLRENWRWQMCLMRAYYDAYTRHRLLYEQELEAQANTLLLKGDFDTPEAAMDAALALVQRADTQRTHEALRQETVQLLDDLFDSIALQTSVEKHHASGSERGAVLDFLDYPLNNRWWLEDEFEKVRALPEDAAKWARLREIAAWEDPGPGGHYDDIGHVAKAPNTVRGKARNTVPYTTTGNIPTFWWWDGGYSRQRLSWQVTQDWPDEMRYENLDPEAEYLLRLTGYGEAFVVADGERLSPTRYGKEIGEIKEFPVPRALTQDGRLSVVFERPEESHLNWRQQSRLAEMWLIKVR